MNAITSQIQHLVNDFAHQIASLAQRAAVDALHGALGSSNAPRGGATPASKSPSRHSRGKGAKRSPAELEALEAKFVSFVASHEGLRIEQINKELGTSTADLALPIRKLVASKRIRTKGQKRSTTYFAGNAGEAAVKGGNKRVRARK